MTLYPCILLTVLTLAVCQDLTTTETLDSTTADSYLTCLGWLPETLPTWPTDLPYVAYTRLYHVCAAGSKQPRKIGCRCSSSSTNSLDCDNETTDAVLRHVMVASRTLPELCLAACFCSSDPSPDEPNVVAGVTYSRQGSSDGTTHSFQGSSNGGEEEEAQSDEAAGPRRSESSASEAGQRVDRRPSRKTRSCAADPSVTCSGPRDCSMSRYCKCRVRSERFVPGEGVSTFTTGCLAAAEKSFNGRSLVWRDLVEDRSGACACNGTFVHPHCCDADNGLVHGNVASWGIVA